MTRPPAALAVLPRSLSLSVAAGCLALLLLNSAHARTHARARAHTHTQQAGLGVPLLNSVGEPGPAAWALIAVAAALPVYLAYIVVSSVATAAGGLVSPLTPW